MHESTRPRDLMPVDYRSLEESKRGIVFTRCNARKPHEKKLSNSKYSNVSNRTKPNTEHRKEKEKDGFPETDTMPNL